MVAVLTSKPIPLHKRLHAKLDHLLHHPGLEAFKDFRADLSNGMQGLIAASQEFSLSWVQQGFKLLHGLDRGFAKLIESVDCPMSEWESELVDEYLGYTLEVLDLLNQMSSALSHLDSVRLALAHAIGSPSDAARRLLQSADHDHRRRSTKWGSRQESGSKALHGKQGVVLQAVVDMRGVALWVCWVIVCGLGGHMDNGVPIPVLEGVDSRTCGEMVEKRGVLKEVREVKEMMDGVLAAADVMAGEESMEMERKVERFQSKLEEAVEELNRFFSQLLASRNRLMDCFRLHSK